MGDAPAVVAIAVPAPAPTAPAFPAFLVHAARATGAGGDELAVTYDPLVEPALLFVTAAVAPASARRPRRPACARRWRRSWPDRSRPPIWRRRAPATARSWAAAVVRSRPAAPTGRASRSGARRAQLGLDGAALGAPSTPPPPPSSRTPPPCSRPRRTAAVVAGGAIR
ncbi:MAG: hypothetical protein HS111_23075 [Kofleriaceae bacterium]|nr:hypothetical protein [Kofleriaceae bacterium]